MEYKTCRLCGKKDIDTDLMVENIDYIKKTNWYAHTNCYNLTMKAKDGIKVTEKMPDSFWQSAAYEYLRRNIKVTINNGLFFKQWNQLLKDEKYTAKGIYFALLYFYSFKKGNQDKANGGIGIIPYIYDDSVKYWYDLESKQRGIVAHIEEQLKTAAQQKEKVIHKKESKKVNKRYDFNMLDELEDEK